VVAVGGIFNVIMSVIAAENCMLTCCRLCLCDGCWHVWNIFAYDKHNKRGEFKLHCLCYVNHTVLTPVIFIVRCIILHFILQW